ncbi:G-protein coupled receptor Mth2-like [Venturia canescens]|uniref:G-protein coupled receptor Mth2-like n=1 Tax=Venturia canescens TaxID=32260 RepID=UPI001C9CB916|nr:G-protein coupled receptor Mth2-like [Venturia canescens]
MKSRFSHSWGQSVDKFRSKTMRRSKEMKRRFYPLEKRRSVASMCRKKSFLMLGAASSASLTLFVSIVCFAALTKTTLALTTPKPNTIVQVSLNETVPDISYRTLPRVGKCCAIDEVLVKDGNEDSKCVSIASRLRSTDDNDSDVFSPLFSDFNQTGALAPGDKYDRFLAIVGDPCRFKRYMLSPSESSDDEYYLLLNGSIFAPRHMPSMLSPGTDYCMDIVPGLGTVALVCFDQESSILTADSRITFYACGLLISVPFLVLTIVAYCITPCLMDVHGKALCHYCGCLAVAFATLAIAQLTSSHLSDQMCISIAFVIQFSFVACFFWLNVMCIETWLQVRRHVKEPVDEIDGGAALNGNAGLRSSEREAKKLFFYYSLWAWIPPLILIVLSMIMDLSPTIPTTYVKPNFGAESCWFQSDQEAMPYFYVPVGLLVVANIVLFTMTAITITRHQRELDLRRLARNRDSDREEQRIFRRLKRVFLVCLGLFFLMGMNWAMELISWWAGGDPLAWSAFDLVNALQGLLVFGIFVMRKPVRTIVWYQVQKIRGNNVTEPDVSSADRSLIAILNSDTLSRRVDC